MVTLNELFAKLQDQPLVGESGRLDVKRYSALYYATQLLRLLRENRDLYRVVRQMSPSHRLIDGLAEELREVVGSFFRGGMMNRPDALSHIRDLEPLFARLTEMEKRNDLHQPVILTRAVALALHKTALADMTMRQFANYYEVGPGELRRVGPGDPVPTCFGIFGRQDPEHRKSRRGEYGTNPLNLPVWRNPDRLPSVVLAPEIVSAFDLRLNFDYQQELLKIQEGNTVVATFHPSRALIKDIAVDVYPPKTLDRFFHVRVRTEEDNMELPQEAQPYLDANPPRFDSRASFRNWMRRAIESAAAAGANLFLFPELILDESDVEDVYRSWHGLAGDGEPAGTAEFARPQLLVPGSWHVGKKDTSRINVTEIWGSPDRSKLRMTDRSGTTLQKIVPYAHRYVNPATESDAIIVEDISTSRTPEILLFCSQNATMMVLICVDFLLDQLRDLARDLYASLLLIPSMSQKIRVFRELMIGHVAATEAVAVFVDCLEAIDEDYEGTIAIVRHPDRNGSVDVNPRALPELTSEPGVVIIDLDAENRDDQVRWIAC